MDKDMMNELQEWKEEGDKALEAHIKAIIRDNCGCDGNFVDDDIIALQTLADRLEMSFSELLLFLIFERMQRG